MRGYRRRWCGRPVPCRRWRSFRGIPISPTMSAFLLIPVSVRNHEVVMLGGLTRYAAMTLVSRPEIRTAKDLLSGVIGLQRPGDAYEKNARSALQHLKVNPDKDVKFLYLGTNEAMWIALDARKVSATMVSPPATLFARKAAEFPRESLGAEGRIPGLLSLPAAPDEKLSESYIAHSACRGSGHSFLQNPA